MKPSQAALLLALTAGLGSAGLASASLRAPLAEARCSIGTRSDGGGVITATPSAPVGQSFVACEDGIITRIVVHVGGATGSSHRLGLQPGTDLMAPTYSQMGTILSGNTFIQFNPAFPVTSGTVYSLSLTPVPGVLRLIGIDPLSYAEGSVIQVVEGVSVPLDADLEFSLTISDPPVPISIATWGQVKSTYR